MTNKLDTHQQITDICASNGGATKPMIDKLDALLKVEVAKAKIAALQDYLDNGEWINTEHMGYAGQKAVLEKRIATLTAEVESNEL